MEDLNKVREEAFEKIRGVRDATALERVRIYYLGRKDGKVTEALKAIKDWPLEKKRTEGPKLINLRDEIEAALAERSKSFRGRNGSEIDLTLPGKRGRRGSRHPLSIAQEEIIEIFRTMNFAVVEGPEVESEYYNFDALNIPAHHPAREMWDTFWIKNPNNQKGERLLMRTHTSPVQIRFMEKKRPPFQIVAPGRVFRYEATDARHEVNFHQVEGLMVGRTVSLANFKFVVEEFLRQFFKKKLEFRFRPSYFPFTEPSVEVDIRWSGKNKWLEVMGAGMVHEQVLRGVRIDPRKWQGFAFGTGVERLAMLKYGIPDIRMFYEGDLRFIRQF